MIYDKNTISICSEYNLVVIVRMARQLGLYGWLNIDVCNRKTTNGIGCEIILYEKYTGKSAEVSSIIEESKQSEKPAIQINSSHQG